MNFWLFFGLFKIGISDCIGVFGFGAKMIVEAFRFWFEFANFVSLEPRSM